MSDPKSRVYKVGDKVWAWYDDDQAYYEAAISAVHETDGAKYYSLNYAAPEWAHITYQLWPESLAPLSVRVSPLSARALQMQCGLFFLGPLLILSFSATALMFAGGDAEARFNVRFTQSANAIRCSHSQRCKCRCSRRCRTQTFNRCVSFNPCLCCIEGNPCLGCIEGDSSLCCIEGTGHACRRQTSNACRSCRCVKVSHPSFSSPCIELWRRRRRSARVATATAASDHCHGSRQYVPARSIA
jgi:hypothetical protein